jgi:hypothetical protein
VNLSELKPRGEPDKYIDIPLFDESSQRSVESLWEVQAGLTVQPRREPWGRTKTQAETLGPKDGMDGDDGIDGTDGQDGEDGAQGPEGPPGSDATLPSGIIVFATVADLGDGWQLCDGTNGTPDLRDKFIVTVGPSYSYGDTGGFKWHGQTENNHNDHYLRHITHAQDGVEYDLTTGVCLQFPGSDNVVTSISLPDCDVGDDGTWGVAAWCGPSSGTLPESQKPTDDHYAEHYGPYNGNLDTDNRPPYIALYAHMKL